MNSDQKDENYKKSLRFNKNGKFLLETLIRYSLFKSFRETVVKNIMVINGHITFIGPHTSSLDSEIFLQK